MGGYQYWLWLVNIQKTKQRFFYSRPCPNGLPHVFQSLRAQSIGVLEPEYKIVAQSNWPVKMSNNATANGTATSINCSEYPTAERVAKTLAYCVIIVVSLTGNILIGSIVFKVKSMRRTINYLIVNMAMSDIILPIFAVPRILTRLYLGYWLIDGHFGSALCKLVYFLQDVSNAVSIQSLVLIAVDRFGAVVFPLRRPVVSAKLCPYFILSTWIVAMALHSPYFFARKLDYSEGLLRCALQWEEAFGESSSEASYYVAMFLLLAVIPFALMSILYSIIILNLRAQKIPGGESVRAE